ncbi:MAG TPA: hypothetical protein VJ461_02745 [Candidatus Nanoarchaeia archaeon]|nr:hypothetical protein [Candidatus Nanoarchaeia archaeon]
MGMIVDAIYSSFPGLADLEKRTEEAIDTFSKAFRMGKGIGDYVLNNTDKIINTLEKSVTSYFSGLISAFKQDFLGSYAKGYTKAYGQKQEAKPIVKVSEKKNTLDDLVNDFRLKIKQYNPVYDVSIDVYDNGNVLKSYAAKSYANKCIKKEERKEEEVRPVNNSMDYSIRIAELYNQGYKTRWIVKEAGKNGYAGIKSYKDIAEKVAEAITTGAAYTRGKYNNTIATRLGANEQIINDYVSGKSYKEIKENLKKSTNGMSISDSSILRIMHGYEKKSGEKLVGKRKNVRERKNGNSGKRRRKSS